MGALEEGVEDLVGRPSEHIVVGKDIETCGGTRIDRGIGKSYQHSSRCSRYREREAENHEEIAARRERGKVVEDDRAPRAAAVSLLRVQGWLIESR